MKKFFAFLVFMAVFCSNVSANTIVFKVPAGFTGGSVNGFTFSDNWYNNGRSPEPYMEYYDQSHSITFDAGTFAFAGMSLSATPWDGYGFGGGAVNVDFKDTAGSIIASNRILLAGGDGFVAFNQTVVGVHEIYFHATGGFWPRLASIDVDAAAVPEPESIALLLTGLGLIGLMSGRRRSSISKV